MGAEEKPEPKAKTYSGLVSPTVEEKLERGWRLSETQEGQLLLVPPPSYGAPEAA
jgi:hypothetical protein